MSRAIWKFEIPVDARWHDIPTPLPAHVQHVGCQRPGVVAIWAEVTPSSEKTGSRRMRVFGTGHEVEGSYVGTAFDGPFVWHVYAEALDKP